MGPQTIERLRTDLQYFIDLSYLAKNGPVSVSATSLTAIIANLKQTYQEIEMAMSATTSDAAAVAARMVAKNDETQKRFQEEAAAALERHSKLVEEAAASFLDQLQGNPTMAKRLQELLKAGESAPLPSSSSEEPKL